MFEKMLSLRDQCAHSDAPRAAFGGCALDAPAGAVVVAIPLLRGEMYRKVPERMGVATILGGNRYLVPFNRGIATPVCALVRNDSKSGMHTGKHQFIALFQTGMGRVANSDLYNLYKIPIEKRINL